MQSLRNDTDFIHTILLFFHVRNTVLIEQHILNHTVFLHQRSPRLETQSSFINTVLIESQSAFIKTLLVHTASLHHGLLIVLAGPH